MNPNVNQYYGKMEMTPRLAAKQAIKNAKIYLEKGTMGDIHMANYLLRDIFIVQNNENLSALAWALHKDNPSKVDVEGLIEGIEEEIYQMKMNSEYGKLNQKKVEIHLKEGGNPRIQTINPLYYIRDECGHSHKCSQRYHCICSYMQKEGITVIHTPDLYIEWDEESKQYWICCPNDRPAAYPRKETKEDG